MKEAIKLAIKSGYHNGINGECTFAIHTHSKFVSFYEEDAKYPDLSFSDILMDPLFWQSLGKSLKFWKACYHYEVETKNWEPYSHKPRCNYGKPKWEVEWHRFIDAIAKGKNEDDFFKELIKSNTITK